MNGYEKRTAKKRAEIIAAAQELFSERGIVAVSITEIAAKAGVSRVTLFKYFGDKDELAREVVTEWVSALLAEYENIMSSDMPLDKKLLLILNTRMEKRKKIGNLFLQEAAWKDVKLQKFFGQLASKHALPKIMQLIEEGKATGLIDPEMDNEAILLYFSVLGPIISDPKYINKGEKFQKSLYNLFVGGLIKDWNNAERRGR